MGYMATEMMMTTANDKTLYTARNTSMRHVARLFLSWAEDQTEMSIMAFVGKIARDRLSHAEANIVIDDAWKIYYTKG